MPEETPKVLFCHAQVLFNFGGDCITDLSLLAGRLLGSSLLAAVRLSIYQWRSFLDIKIHVKQLCQVIQAQIIGSLGHWYATSTRRWPYDWL